MKRRLISSRDATDAQGQHRRPCSDCPWSRESLEGWLGSLSVEEWLQVAHTGGGADCHALRGAQCAGMAIYQRHVCVLPREPSQRELVQSVERDTERVFSGPEEFRKHHTLRKLSRRKA